MPLAVDNKFSKVIFKIDFTVVFNCVTKLKSMSIWKLRLLFQDIRQLLKSIPRKKLSLIRRKANKMVNWVDEGRKCARMVGLKNHHPLCVDQLWAGSGCSIFFSFSPFLGRVVFSSKNFKWLFLDIDDELLEIY